MRQVELDPAPAATLACLHLTSPSIATAMEEALDWIEADPVDPRVQRRQFSHGTWAVVRLVADAEWLILLDEDPPGTPVIRFIGETASL